VSLNLSECISVRHVEYLGRCDFKNIPDTTAGRCLPFFQNVRNWHNIAALSSWYTQSLWAGWLTYNMGASESTLGRGNHRRRHNCPSTWKSNILNPRCPEPNQLRDVPPLYDIWGGVVMAIIPQPIPGKISLSMVIADRCETEFAGQLQPSGRKYICDEFPPASWTANSRQAIEYCAPRAFIF
jgi:hypothetical protein